MSSLQIIENCGEVMHMSVLKPGVWYGFDDTQELIIRI